MKLIASILAAAILLITPALAQWQVTNHAVPIGNGAGVVGFSAATTGTGGRVFIDQGVGVDPAFVTISGDCTLTLTGVMTCSGGGGSGTVTDVSVVSANGFAGSVATSTTTPAITLSTTVTGILSGNGTAISAASTTGSGAVVLATSPALVSPALGTPTALVGTNITGTAAGLTAGNVTTNANLTGPITSVGNATSVASQTGTGSTFVMNTSPSVSGLTVTGSFTATGLVGNASLTNPSTTVNGQTCTLGASCTVTAAATSIAVGTTSVTAGTTTRVLFDNAGTLGEYAISGTGNVAMTTSPTLVTPNIGAATGESLSVSSASTGALLTATSTDSGAAASPILDLYRDSSSPAANDIIGNITFNGEDSAGNKQEYASLETIIADPVSASEDSSFDLYLQLAGARTRALAFGVGQILFPATQNPSSSPNILDDYREGTWTPAITFGGSSTGVTYAIDGQVGSYIKIGRMVLATGRIQLTSNGTGVGNAVIDGFPGTFTAGGYGGALTFWSGTSGVSGSLFMSSLISTNTAILRYASATASVNATDTTITDSALINFNLTYMATQ